MTDQGDHLQASPLGKTVVVPVQYDSAMLFAIPRAEGRRHLYPGLAAAAMELPFGGEDCWTAWELSWLTGQGKPVVAVARLVVPADSPNMIESKSLKLYLQGINHSVYAQTEQLQQVLIADLSRVAGAPVSVELLLPASWNELTRTPDPTGICLDDQDIDCVDTAPDSSRLNVAKTEITETLYSHLFRSLCPVTGQPDWATVSITYSGVRIQPAGLLQYLLGYRAHAAFHEQCVEQIFIDIQTRCAPVSLDVSAQFLRRGGLDINPRRVTAAVDYHSHRALDIRQ